MVKKRLADYTIKDMIMICIVFTFVLFLSREVCFSVFCKITEITEENPIYNIYHSLFMILLFVCWGLFATLLTISKIYRTKTTGRNFITDTLLYKMNYHELIDCFKDADPLKIDVETLPQKDWKECTGLVFGKVGDRLICYEPENNGNDGINAISWGSPGDGKTASTIVTSCRQFGLHRTSSGKMVQVGSVMTIDIKGDIYSANKEYRKIKLFSTLDVQNSYAYDPLTDVRKADTVSEKSLLLENLAITLIPSEGGSDSKYFIDGARDFLIGIILYSLNKDSRLSFPEIVARIVNSNYSRWVVEIMNDEADISGASAYTNQFYGQNEKNVAGCYAQLVSSCRLFCSDLMKNLLSNDREAISFDDLENGIDIYIQIAPNQIQVMAPLIAMIYQAFMSAALYRKERQSVPICFVLDEFGQLPAMPVITQSVALMRAYNCSILFACQSLSMLEQKYGVAGRKILMDCIKINCFLSAQDTETREWASRLIGSRKVLRISKSVQSQSNATSKTVSEHREPIFEPAEFGVLPQQDAVIIAYKGKYIKAEKTYFFK